MEIALILGPFYLVMGLSILLYGKAWQEVMKRWEKDHLSLYPVAMMLFIFGLIIVNLHNVWEWSVWVIVTVIGWIMVLKGVYYLLMPGCCIKWALRLRRYLALIYVGGAFWVVIGAVLSWFAYSPYWM